MSCKQQAGEEVSKNVTLNTSGIFTPITITYDSKTIDNEIDFGEYELGTGEKLFALDITNNTDFPITELSLSFSAPEVEKAFNYAIDPIEGDKLFPGFNGTCLSILASKATCKVMLALEANIDLGSKHYAQGIKVHYKNLVGFDSRDLIFKVFAGFEASLVYQNGETQFSFGNKVRNYYLVEREDKVQFHQNLIVTNSGDLSARNIGVNFSTIKCDSLSANGGIGQSCGSLPSQFQQDYLYSSWKFEHNCPATLLKDESCEIDVYFDVLNQNPAVGPVPEEIEKINYNITTRVSYLKDPDNTSANLNGYFPDILSTRIEAEFQANQELTDFEEVVIAGRREMVTFLLKNIGFQKGFLHRLFVKDTGTGDVLGICIHEGQVENYLKCYKLDETTPTVLKELPFFFKDRSNCFTQNGSVGTDIIIDQVCVLDAYFQPSIQFTAEKNFQITVEAEYDTQWKGLETIVQKKVHTHEANSSPVAKVVMDGFSFGGKTCEVGSNVCTTMDLGSVHLQFSPEFVTGDYVGCYDNTNKVSIPSTEISKVECEEKMRFNYYQDISLGRLALVNSAFAAGQEISIDIKLKNIGKESAINTSFFMDYTDLDGDLSRSGVSIDSESNKTSHGVNSSFPYYKDIHYIAANCDVISPDSICNIKFDLHPIALSNNCENVQSMFTNENSGIAQPVDGIDCSVVNSVSAQLSNLPYKLISMQYDDGSWFDDDNLYTDTQDIPARINDVKIFGTLVTKGALSSISKQNKNIAGNVEMQRSEYIIIQNIGTGSIGYIGWRSITESNMGDQAKKGDSLLEYDNLNFVPVDNPSLYDGAQYDCLKIIDFNYNINTDRTSAVNILSRRNTALNSLTGALTPAQVRTIRDQWSGDMLGLGEKCVLKFDVAAEKSIFTSLNDYYFQMSLVSTPTVPDDDAFMLTPFTLNLKEYGQSTETEYTGVINDFRLRTNLKVKLDYYDGDNEPSSNPSIQALIDSGETVLTNTNVAFGSLINEDNSQLGIAPISIMFRLPSTPVISSVSPLMSAFIYKKGFSLDEQNQEPSLTGTTSDELDISNLWYWSLNNYPQRAGASSAVLVDESGYFQGYNSGADPVISTQASSYLTTNDYVVHFGSFPEAKDINASFSLSLGIYVGETATIVDESFSASSAFSIDSLDLAVLADNSTHFALSATPRLFTINSSTIGENSIDYTLKYTTNINDVPTCTSNCTRKIYTLNIKIIANIIASAPELTLAEEDCFDSNPDDLDFSCTWQTTTDPLLTQFNHQGITPVQTYEKIIQENPTPTTNGYIKRRIHVSNSTGTDINNFKFMYKNSITDLIVTNFLSDIDNDAITISFDNGVDTAGCQDEVDSAFFAASTSCYIEIFYQPYLESSISNLILYFMYELDSNQYVHQALELEFKPQSPASLAPDVASPNIDLAFAPKYDDPATGVLNLVQFGAAGRTYEVRLDQSTTFNSSSVLFSEEIPIINISETMASFLRAYQTFAGKPNDTDEPIAGEYIDVSGFSGVHISSRSTDIGVMDTYANSECLVGDGSEVVAILRGFDNTGDCRIKIKYTLNVNSSGVAVKSSDVTNTFIILPYYNFKRASTETMYMYLKFKVMPNNSTALVYGGGKYYGDVMTTHVAGNKVDVSFKWSDMLVNDASVGAIDGYRIIYGDSNTDMQNNFVKNAVWGTIANKFTGFVEVNAATFSVTIPGLTQGKHYYFKVLPIRKSAAYTLNLFTGLNSGRYLGESNIPDLHVVTPPEGYSYDHSSFRIYENSLSSGSSFNYTDSLDFCSSERINLKVGGTSVSVKHKLIDFAGRDFIISDSSLSTYDFGTLMHWISAPKESPSEAGFGALPGYDVTNTSVNQELTDTDGTEYYYLRDNNDLEAPLAHFYGPFGVLANNVYGLAMDTPLFNLGYARCFVELGEY